MNAARRPLFFITSGQHPDERADFVDKYFAKQIDRLLAYIRDGKVAGHLRSLHLARSTDRTASTAAQRVEGRQLRPSEPAGAGGGGELRSVEVQYESHYTKKWKRAARKPGGRNDVSRSRRMRLERDTARSYWTRYLLHMGRKRGRVQTKGPKRTWARSTYAPLPTERSTIPVRWGAT